MSHSWESKEEIKRFRRYLQIQSVHPNINYEKCVEFLLQQAEDINLECKVYYISAKTHPVVVITWKGTDSHLTSILLNSHMDVVPVYEDKWLYPPFAAEIDKQGRIYARGSQDMKCVGMQYLEAIRRLIAAGVRCRRTFHLSYVPDEEVSSPDGMLAFVNSKEFRSLNVGFCLDEGMASNTDTFRVFYGERCIWQIAFKIRGNAGHGSLLHRNTPGEKLRVILDKLMDLRESEAKELKRCDLADGDVTTINLTMLSGGCQVNVVPPELEACFDIRLSNKRPRKQFEAMLQNWCEEAGGDITMETIYLSPYVEPSRIDNKCNFWTAFHDAMDDMGCRMKTEIFAGGTDGNFVRELGIPTIGFSPINGTEVRMHDHNEYLGADVYMKGIEIYEKILEKIGNCDSSSSIPQCNGFGNKLKNSLRP